MFRLLIVTALAVSLLAMRGTAAEPKHKHLHHALYEMKEAQTELKEAKHNFGGHKEKALEALHVAIKETEKALEAAGDPYKTFSPGKIYGDYKNHPHLRHSLVAMREAHSQLKASKDDFGGHRDKAVLELDAAIFQVKDCIEYARD
jgi:hypothetical protein